jgi:hypothetical protein
VRTLFLIALAERRTTGVPRRCVTRTMSSTRPIDAEDTTVVCNHEVL